MAWLRNLFKNYHYKSTDPLNMFSLWRYKMAWITNIFHGAMIICDETKLLVRLDRIKNLVFGMVFPNELI